MKSQIIYADRRGMKSKEEIKQHLAEIEQKQLHKDYWMRGYIKALKWVLDNSIKGDKADGGDKQGIC